MAQRTSKKNGTTLNGTNANDTLTVKHAKITVNGLKGVDTINITKGANHKVYGGIGNDKITVGKSAGSGSKIYGDDAKSKLTGNDKFFINGGKKNYFYGGKGTDTFTVNAGSSNYLYGGVGTDTFTVNGGSSNYLYGGAGVDTFVIGKTSTGTATVKDFTASDKVKVSGNTSNIYVSGKNMIIKGGKSGKSALTLINAKGKTFTVTDSRGSYKVNSANIALTLTKYFKGTLAAPSFIITIDARKLAYEKSSYGYDISRTVNVTGNAKANTIYVANIDGGTWQGGAGGDTIKITKGNNHIVYGDDKAGKLSGNDTITISGGAGHQIYGGAGTNTITVEKAYSDDGESAITIKGGSGIDTIRMYGGGTTYNRDNYIYGGAGKDRIYLYGTVKNYIKIYGESGNDTIDISGGYSHTIDGGAGDDAITIKGGSNHTINGGTGIDTIKVSSGRNTIDGGSGDDKIYLYQGISVENKVRGGAGNDKIFIYDGNHDIDSGDNNDTITISGGSGTLYSSHEIKAGAGEDTIKITGGEKIRVNGGVDKDTIIITSGSNHQVYNDGGDDSIFINAGSGDSIGVYGSTTAAEYVEINAGDKHYIRLYNGENKILVTSGKEHDIATGIHNDTITVQNAYVSDIDTGEGNDIVTIKDGAYVNNFKNYDNSISLSTRDGDDVITVGATAGDKSFIDAGNGDDKIYIHGGKEHKIYTGNGDDIIEITGGEKHTIILGTKKNTLTIAAKDSIINTNKSANDDITINWTKGEDNGTYTINSVYDSILYGDKLTIKGATSSDFHTIKLEGESYNKKLIMMSDDGNIVINNWFRTNQGTNEAAFETSGIYFSNGEHLNYADIH